MINKIVETLDLLFSNPRCELNYNKDYELLISVMLSAQTTDIRVNSVTSILYKKYDRLEKLASANKEDIINIIKPIGTYTRKSENVIEISKRLLADCDGKVINDRNYLETLPGVGRKTVNVVLSNLYDENVIAVDTHVARVAKRLNLAKANDDVLTIEKKLTKKFKNYNLGRLHHQLVLFGRYYCKAKKPECSNCNLKDICQFYKKINKK